MDGYFENGQKKYRITKHIDKEISNDWEDGERIASKMEETNKAHMK
jgi:hypothetical protein